MQKEAIFYIAKKSQQSHTRKQKQVIQRIQKLGYSRNQYEKFLEYIRDDAPIIIHISLKNLNFLINDKYYRNLFETGHGNGSDNQTQRKKWENDIFNNIYNNAQPTERVKYGVLNYLSSPKGHDKCGFYGKSFFTMKEVRLRCTFSNKDTSDLNPILCTPQFFSHILYEFTDNNIKQIFDLIVLKKKKNQSYSYQDFQAYQEVQFHGLLDISKNVDSLNICIQELNQNKQVYENTIKQFQNKYGDIKIKYF